MATPAKMRAVYHAVVAAAARAGAPRARHVSRFDPDGAVVFFTFSGDAAASADAVRAAAESAAEEAGGWLLGARVTKLDPLSRALRDRARSRRGS